METKSNRNRGGGNIIVNKKDLKTACAIARDAILCSSEINVNTDYVFSDTFHRKMKLVFMDSTKLFNARYYLRFAASIALIITISIGSVFAVNIDARNRFGNWIITIFQDKVVYENNQTDIFSNEEITISLENIKNEYTTDVWSDDEDLIIIALQKNDEIILLSCQGENWIIGLSAADYKYQQTIVKNNPADFYEVIGGDGTNEMFWLDESGCFVNLSGKLNAEEMKCLAEKISIVKKK